MRSGDERTEGHLLRFPALTWILIALASLASFLAFTWPLYIPESLLGFSLTQENYWIFFLFIPVALLALAIEINRGAIDIKAIALLAVLAALAASLRQIGAGAVGIEPMWFLIILAARVFGPSFGFALGAIAMSLSAILTGGIGPWLPFQIMAASWIGLLAGSLPRSLRGQVEIMALMITSLIAGMSFGLLMDLQLWPWIVGGDTSLSFQQGAGVSENLNRFLTFHLLTAMAWDIPRSILTAILVWITGRPVINALRRTQRKTLILNEREMERKAA
ncbi:MAG: ECF transporter S component [Actinobacteria bacterium]|nr:ECF transporter S component [Actinomycetota bacterium]